MSAPPPSSKNPNHLSHTRRIIVGQATLRGNTYLLFIRAVQVHHGRRSIEISIEKKAGLIDRHEIIKMSLPERLGGASALVKITPEERQLDDSLYDYQAVEAEHSAAFDAGLERASAVLSGLEQEARGEIRHPKAIHLEIVEQNGRIIKGISTDISRSGIGIMSAGDFDLGKEVYIRFCDPKEPVQHLKLHGILRNNRYLEGAGFVHRIGVVLFPYPRENFAEWCEYVDYVASQQRQSKK